MKKYLLVICCFCLVLVTMACNDKSGQTGNNPAETPQEQADNNSDSNLPQKCADDEWGEACQKCNCPESMICNKTDGSCACPAGHTGSACLPITCKHGTLDQETGKCSACDNYKYKGDNCDQCRNPVMNYDKECNECNNSLLDPQSNCTICNNPLLSATDGCTKCDNPLLSAADGCTECNNPLLSATDDCLKCDNPLLSAADGCTECNNPLLSATDDCLKCDNPLLSAADGCLKCDNPLLSAADGCTECNNSLLSAADGCLKCDNPLLSAADSCTECNNPLLSAADGCTKCDNPIMSAESNCTSCQNGLFGEKCDRLCKNLLLSDESDCHECLNPLKDPASGCLECYESQMYGDFCDRCKNGLFGQNCDCRDDNNYKTVAAAGQYWLAEDIKNPCLEYRTIDSDNQPNAEKIGYFYNLENARKACPRGWRLPTVNDYNALADYARDRGDNEVDGLNQLGLDLKATGGFLQNYQSPNWAYYWTGDFLNNDKDTKNIAIFDFSDGTLSFGNNITSSFFPVRCLTDCENPLMSATSGCSKCSDASYSEESGCLKCKNELLNPQSNCTVCNDPSFSTESGCLKCANSLLTEESGCTVCRDNPRRDPATNCQKCLNLLSGDNCEICNDGYGELCQAYDTVTDSDNNVYKTVIINGLEWMAENSRKKPVLTSASDLYIPYNMDFSDENIKQYGLYYSNNAWKKNDAVCPKDWRLPTKQEIDDLLEFAQKNTRGDSAFTALIANDADWDGFSTNGSVDDFGLALRPTGYAYNNTNNNSYKFIQFGQNYYLLSSEKTGNNGGINYYCLRLNNSGTISKGFHVMFTEYYPIRCVKKL